MAAKLDADWMLGALAEAGAAVAVVGDAGVLHANRAAKQLGDLAALAKKGGPTLVAVDGRTWEVTAAPADGRVVLVGRDVTEREEARRALAAADELLSFASHELKGPLHVLGLACHVIETRVARGDKVEKSQIDQIRRQVTRFTRLINELLDLSRLRESRLELMFEPLDLVEVVRTAAQVEGARAADVKLELPRPPVAMRGDRARLLEVVGQLVDNAARHTPPGTPIAVALTTVPGRATLTVADRGPGVPEADVAELFEARTFRGRAPSKTRQGLGIGLYLACALARLHGGELVYERNSPSGALFRLTLPL